MPTCVFCDIVEGRAPASKVLETGRVLALIPLRPKARDHVLVIPKDHFEKMHDVPAATLHEIVDLLARIARALSLESYNVLQNNGPDASGPEGPPPEELIAHIHFHLVPRAAGDRVELPSRTRSSPTQEELDRMAAEVRARLEDG